MDKGPTLSRLKRVLSVLEKKNKRYVTLEMLSRWVGIYEDVLADDLVYFEPMIRMDPTINMNDLREPIRLYIEEANAKAKTQPKKAKAAPIKKKEVGQYSSIVDYIYKELAGPGGLMPSSMDLNEKQLRLIEKLAKTDLQKIRKAKAKANNNK